MSRAHKYFRILFKGSASSHYYFDVKGAQIFQNTLFRGVQTFIIILMCRAHKYFRILYLGGVPKLAHYFDVKGAQIFQNTFLGECKHSL